MLESNRQKTDALLDVQLEQSKRQCASFFSYRYITLLKEYDNALNSPMEMGLDSSSEESFEKINPMSSGFRLK